MNGKITQALSDTASGDIMKYYQEMDHIIQVNDGIHDCKMLSMECYDRPTPVKYNQYKIPFFRCRNRLCKYR